MKSNLHASFGYHESEAEDEVVDERVVELLNTSHNPCDFFNLTYAIGEDALAKHISQIEEAMQKRDFLTLGRILWNDVTDYWERQANTQASNEYNQTLG